jgi:COMPASS component BRE2
MAKKQRVIPRLKPVPYTLTDLSTTLKQPQLVPSTKLNNTKIQLYSTPDLPNNKRGFKYVPCRPNPYLDSILYSTTDIPPYSTHWSYFDRSPEMYINDDITIVGTQETDGWRSTRAEFGIREGKWYIEYKIINGINAENNGNSESSNEFRSATPMLNGNFDAHVRVGIARKEAALEAPVGFDGYGYGIRDINCEKIHLSRRSEIKNENSSINPDLKVGDVIGILLELPSIQTQKEISRLMIEQQTISNPTFNYTGKIDSKKVESSFIEKGIERDRIPIKYKSELYFEEYEYTGSKTMEHLLNPVTVFGEHAIPDKERFKPAILPDSSLTLYVNGERVGKPFENLFAFLPPASEQKMARNTKTLKKSQDDFIIDRDDGSLGYYPMVSCFRGGAVQINASPKIWQLPQSLQKEFDEKSIKAYGARFKDKTIEDYVLDLFDDTINKYLDKKEREL